MIHTKKVISKGRTNLWLKIAFQQFYFTWEVTNLRGQAEMVEESIWTNSREYQKNKMNGTL